MKLRTMLGGLLAVGLLSTGCGGTMPEEMAPEQNLSEAEQAVFTCPEGYTHGSYWDCAQVCGLGWGNFQVHYCYNATDYYEIGNGPTRCGACY